MACNLLPKTWLSFLFSSSISPNHNTKFHMSWTFTLFGSFTPFSIWDTLYVWPEVEFSLAVLRMLVIYSYSPCLLYPTVLNEILLLWTPQVPGHCTVKDFASCIRSRSWCLAPFTEYMCQRKAEPALSSVSYSLAI